MGKPSGYTTLLIILLFLVGMVLGINYFIRPFAPAKTTVRQEEVKKTATTSAVQIIKDNLTTKQKIAGMLILPTLLQDETNKTGSFFNDQNLLAQKQASDASQIAQKQLNDISQEKVVTDDQTFWDWVRNNQPAGLVVFGTDISDRQVIQVSQQLKKIKPAYFWLAVDQEGGSVARLTGDGFSPMPSWQKLCQASESGRLAILDQSARELSGVGINMLLGPVVDVASRSAILKDRVCSADPAMVSLAARQSVAAYENVGILPIIKHFPGIGSVRVDLHKRFGIAEVSNDDGMPFQVLLSQFPSLAVMTTHAGVSGICEDQGCSLNPSCINALTSRYPRALLVTDALDMNAAGYTGTPSGSLSLVERSQKAIEAGNHLLLYGQGVSLTDIDEIVNTLSQKYETDTAFADRVNNALATIEGYRLTYLKK